MGDGSRLGFAAQTSLQRYLYSLSTINYSLCFDLRCDLNPHPNNPIINYLLGALSCRFFIRGEPPNKNAAVLTQTHAEGTSA